MNTKSLLKELLKDPQIKALYNEGIDRSIVNRLIVESLMEEETPKPPTEEEINAINDIKVLNQLVQKFANVNPEDLRPADKHNLQDLPRRVRKRRRDLQQQSKATSPSEPQQQPDADNINNATTEEEVTQAARSEVENVKADNTMDNVQKRQAVKDIYELAQDKIKELTQGKAKDSLSPDDESDIPAFQSEFIDALNKKNTPEEVKTVAKNMAQNISKSEDINDKQKKEEIKNIYQLAQDKINELTKGKTEDNLTLQDYKKIIESDELQQIKKVFDAIKKAFEVDPEAKETKELPLDQIKMTVDLNESNTAELITYLSRMIAILKGVMEGEVSFSREGFYELYKKLFDFEETVEELLPLVADSPKKETKALAIMNKKANELEAISQKVLPAPKEDDKTGELATIGVQPPTDDTGEKPQTPEDEKKKVPEYIARESFLENWRPVGIAFDEYEDRFDKTPFLDEQARVLFALRDALQGFDDGLRKAAKPTGKREEAPEQVQEQAGEVIQVQPQEQKKIFKLHKELIRETNALVKIIKQLNDENIYTIGGGKIQKQARIKAKELMNLMKLAFDELEAIKGEEKEKLTFKEQQEMDEETELLRKSHQQILSNMTKMDRIARARPGEEEDAKIDSKYIVPIVKDTLAKIEGMEHMFPQSSPFGKKGDLGEIKIQVKGIARDIIDIVAKLKDFAATSKTKTQNVDKLKEYILNAMATISDSFDIDIEDEELKSLMPKKARPNAPSYNDGAAELKSKFDKFIKEQGPAIAKELKKETLSAYMKVKEFITKNLKKEFGNKVPVIMVAKQLPEVEAEYIDEMEVITRFVDFMVRMLDENEKITFKENIRNFLKQFNFKDRSKLGKQLVKEFTREEIREIKDYLSNKNQLQDLVAVVKQQQKLSYEEVPTYQGNMDDVIGIDPKDAGFEDEKEEPEKEPEQQTTDDDLPKVGDSEEKPSSKELNKGDKYEALIDIERVTRKGEIWTVDGQYTNRNGEIKVIVSGGDKGISEMDIEKDILLNPKYFKKVEDSEETEPEKTDNNDDGLSDNESKFLNSLDEKYKPVFEKVINYIIDQKRKGLFTESIGQKLLKKLQLEDFYNRLKKDNVLDKNERLLFIDALKSSEKIRRDFDSIMGANDIGGLINFDEVEKEVKKLLNTDPEKDNQNFDPNDPNIFTFSNAVGKEVEELDKDDIKGTSQEEIIQKIKDEPEVQEPLKDLNLSSDQVDEIIEDEIETYLNNDEEEDTELLEQILNLEAIKPLLQQDNMEVVKNIAIQLTANKEPAPTQDPDEYIYDIQRHERLQKIFLSVNENVDPKMSKESNEVVIKSIERDIEELKEFLNTDYDELITRDYVDVGGFDFYVGDIMVNIYDIVQIIEKVTEAVKTKDPSKIKTAEKEVMTKYDFEKEEEGEGFFDDDEEWSIDLGNDGNEDWFYDYDKEKQSVDDDEEEQKVDDEEEQKVDDEEEEEEGELSDLEQKVIEEFKVKVGYKKYDNANEVLVIDFKEMISGKGTNYKNESQMTAWAKARMNRLLNALAQHFQEKIYNKSWEEIKNENVKIGTNYTQEYLKETAGPWVKQSILDMFPAFLEWLDDNGLENWEFNPKHMDIPLGDDHHGLKHETVGIAYENDHLEKVIFGVDEVGFNPPGGGGKVPAVIYGEE